MSFLLWQLNRNRVLLDRMQIEQRRDSEALAETIARAQSTIRTLRHRMGELEREVHRLRVDSLRRAVPTNASERECLLARIRELEACLAAEATPSRSISGDDDWLDLKKN